VGSTPAPETPRVTSGDLRAALRDLGLAGQTLMVHSSLRAFGHVEGGAEAVLEALEGLAGCGGTLVLPSFAWCADEDAEGRDLPAEGLPAEGLGVRAFDPTETPADTGRISDTFWRRPGVQRSAHPTHALAARGPHAAHLLAGHGLTRCCPWNGPYGRLAHLDAWVLLLGVGVASLTFLHALEDRAEVPYLGRAVGYVRWPDGRVWAVPQTHYPSGHREFYHPGSRLAQWIGTWGPEARRTTRVGAATVTALRASALAQRVGERLAADPFCLLCTDPACPFCAPWRTPHGAPA
jgi:aminoglycoside 3-N-acetyltransferase